MVPSALPAVFAQVSFAAPVLLLGLLAVAVPIVLHLRRSTVAARLDFPSVRFLQHIARRVARQRRVNRWLLLVLRVLALALAALAFAQPSVRAVPWSVSPLGGSAVLVLDNSMSMQASNNAAFGRARSAVLELLARPDGPEHVALLLPGGAEADAGARWIDRAKAAELVRSAAAVPAAVDLRTTLNQAYALAEQAPTRPATVIVASDFAGLEAGPTTRHTEPVAEPAAVLLLPAGEQPDGAGPAPANVAITALELIGDRAFVGTTVLARTTIRNFGTTPAAAVVHIQMADDTTNISTLSLKMAAAGTPDDRQTVDLSLPLTRAGLRTGRVVLQLPGGPDALPADDARWFGLRVREQLRVLVVADRPTAFRDPAVFVETALGVTPGIAARRITPGELAGTNLDAFDALVATAGVPDDQVARIESWARAGGSAVAFAGSREDAGLVRLVGSAGVVRRGPVAVRAWAAGQPLTAGLVEGNDEIVAWRYSDITPADTTAVLATLTDGRPLVLSRGVGAGQALVIATGPDTRTSNLATQPLFVPLLLRACGMTTAAAALPNTPPGPANAWTLGVIAQAAGEPTIVNPPASESDLRAPSPDVVKQLGGRNVFMGSSTAELASQLEAAATGTLLTDYLLAIAIMLAAGELLVSVPRKQS